MNAHQQPNHTPVELLIKSNPTNFLTQSEERDWLTNTIAAYKALLDESPDNERIAYFRHITELVDCLSTRRLLDLNATENGKQVLESLRDGKTVEATVMSVDIRNSTTLMENAIDPKQFAVFMSDLLSNIHNLIMDDYGIFEKFTGDGALAFFPRVMAGDDHSLRAIRCASKIHTAFQTLYKAVLSTAFDVPIQTGLGIGIHTGNIEVVRIRRRLSIVGKPVVIACRLGGAPAGATYCLPVFKTIVESRDKQCAKFYDEILKTKQNSLHVFRIDYHNISPGQPQWV